MNGEQKLWAIFWVCLAIVVVVWVLAGAPGIPEACR